MTTDYSSLKRPHYKMPDYVEKALKENGVWSLYFYRPAYQQNDYVGWITRGKREETKQKRINQMIDELKVGGVYMNMKWKGKNNL